MKSREDYEREYEEQERKHQALLATLTIPADDDRGSYKDRHLEAQWVKEKRKDEDWLSITGSSGWSVGVSQEIYDLLNEGDAYIAEQKGNRVTGWIIGGKWYGRKTDEDLEAEHQAWLDDWAKKKLETLEKHREEWAIREGALPDWLRVRLQRFHDEGGENFLLEGWGYEIVIAELAVQYATIGPDILDMDMSQADEAAPGVMVISRTEGTTGNQHGFALALAKEHFREPEKSLEGTVSALSPLTGDPYYGGKA